MGTIPGGGGVSTPPIAGGTEGVREASGEPPWPRRGRGAWAGALAGPDASGPAEPSGRTGCVHLSSAPKGRQSAPLGRLRRPLGAQGCTSFSTGGFSEFRSLRPRAIDARPCGRRPAASHRRSTRIAGNVTDPSRRTPVRVSWRRPGRLCGWGRGVLLRRRSVAAGGSNEGQNPPAGTTSLSLRAVDGAGAAQPRSVAPGLCTVGRLASSRP